MKYVYLITLLCIVYLCRIVSCYAQFAVQLPPKDTLIAWQESMNIPALGVAVLEDGKVQQSFVLGALKAEVPAPDNAIFDVSSLTKSIVTWATLKLISKGEWSLDEPLASFWVDPDVKEDPYHKKLTTRHVLSHQSGFKNWRWMREDKKLTFEFEPGTKFGYSGEGFEYLRKALEAKFQQSLDQLIKALVFSPYAMKDSHFIWSDAVDAKRLAIGHNAQGEPYPYNKRLEANAADDMLTTVQDLGHFAEQVFAKKEISPELYATMVSPLTEVRDQVSFGLGWIVMEDLAGGEYALFNAGGDKGVGAVVLLLPKSGRGLIICTNGDQGRRLVMRIMMASLDVGPSIVQRF